MEAFLRALCPSCHSHASAAFCTARLSPRSSRPTMVCRRRSEKRVLKASLVWSMDSAKWTRLEPSGGVCAFFGTWCIGCNRQEWHRKVARMLCKRIHNQSWFSGKTAPQHPPHAALRSRANTTAPAASTTRSRDALPLTESAALSSLLTPRTPAGRSRAPRGPSPAPCCAPRRRRRPRTPGGPPASTRRRTGSRPR